MLAQGVDPFKATLPLDLGWSASVEYWVTRAGRGLGLDKEEYQRMYHLEETHWWYKGMRRTSIAFLGPPLGNQPRRVLDAGCGTGAGLDFLAPHGLAYGVDLAQEGIDLCLLRGQGRLARASVTALPFVEASFDLVTSFDVLYHQAVEDDLLALREFHRVLKAGGLLLVRVPAFDFLRGRHDLAVHTRHRYRSRELRAKLQRAGFCLGRVSYVNCLLFPLALVRRALEDKAQGASDIRPTQRFLNAILLQVLTAEAVWLKRRSLPFGLSLMALARKPAASCPG